MHFGKLNLIEARWNIVAVLCLVIAVVLWVMNQVNAAFVVATLGIVAWFLNQRARFKVLREAYEASRLSIEDSLDDEVRVEQEAREKDRKEMSE